MSGIIFEGKDDPMVYLRNASIIMTADIGGGDFAWSEPLQTTGFNERDGPMTDEDTLWAMEERFWTEGADSARTMTAKGAVFVFPYPVGILQGSQLWRESLVAQRWRSVVFSERCFTREKDVAILAYHVSAERDGTPIHEALCTSSYINDNGKWLRIVHQQTPSS
jgi:hypothetical protein